ncbi:hypothetical protein ATO3_03465 [Marinibacterium profundimaris]|uniref:Calcium-binding protein n=1 Tax=Marinibacterium profundimaris TaxID=1679460 RepID=A0A225NTA7_9RHOB|nr:hypothetical protein ATO3_03465 [Marinibacterium profundimaris]
MSGGDGDDYIRGGDDNDILKGAAGDDVLIGDRGNDVMKGNGGNDRMIWNNGDGSDLMEGGAGHDTAEVNGSDSLGDTFRIRAGDTGRVDFARTNFGNFSLDIGSTEVLEVNGGGGDDVIQGKTGLAGLIKLKLDGGAGEDRISGGDGDDYIRGGDDDDTLSGGAGDDVLVGDRGNDVMRGNGGNDRMIWNNGDGSDIMDGGAGYDTAEVNGSDSSGDAFRIRAGEDGRVDFARTNFGEFTLDIGSTEVLEVNGGGGNDFIRGGTGLVGLIKLKLDGGDGNDTLIGGDGDDRLNGGSDDDVLIGGAGADVFVFNGGDDLIADFEHGTDKVKLGGGLAQGVDLGQSLAQVGADVVLTIGDETLTFADQTLADFGAGDFLL